MDSSASNWGNVAEKFGQILETQCKPEAETRSSAFVQFLLTELNEMNNKEQDSFIFGAMELIKSIKSARAD